MNNPESEIRDNLYGFYDHLARMGRIPSEHYDQWSVISNIHGSWPGLIYRISPTIVDQTSAISLSEKVNSGVYPEVLIAGDENIKEVDSFLRTQGFYPFSAWKGMALNMSSVTSPVLPESVEVIRPETSQDMDQWCEIVANQLIAPEQLDLTFVKNLIIQPPFEAFLLKDNGIGVSTILIFRSETSTGLYLIATAESAQRQGFASLLVQQVLFQETQKSIHPIVLHATSKGEHMYLKLGFKPFNHFFLYRFIKSQP